jgi:hypothetical protein
MRGLLVLEKRRAGARLDPARRALSEQLTRIEKDLKPYEELLERRRRLSTALAALDGTPAAGRRLRWEEIAEHVAAHPGVKAGEIAAALEAPLKNVFAHLARNQDTVFEKREDRWYVREGWEGYRRDVG